MSTPSGSYSGQERGQESDYDRYFAGMDKTMQQKLAFTAAHFLFRPGNKIADMGSGSGLGSFQLAQLNPDIDVIGIDINRKTVLKARQQYKLPNLRFEIGDIERPSRSLGPFDGILNSSVLHHVHTFNGYRSEHVVNALRNQFSCLKMGGTIVIRDFVAWPEDKSVLLDLSTKGTGTTPETMSDADLLVRFSQTARPLVPERGVGFFLEEVEGKDPNWRRFRLPAKWANEFILRKDYRKDWDTEILEEYSWWTPQDYRRELAKLNGRVVYTAPYWNEWIIENRYRGKVRLANEDGTPLDFPPTNFIAVAEKVPQGASLIITEKAMATTQKQYLSITSYRDQETQILYDMASRPNNVFDCIPYTQHAGRLFVYAKHGYPRPLANTAPRGMPNLDDKHWSGHMVEPIAIATEEAHVMQGLAQRSGLPLSDFGTLKNGLKYYPSPGLANEIVQSIFFPLNLSTIAADARHERKIDASVSGFSTGGEVRLYPAQDLLRAAQVGMLPEARLELNIYALMRSLGVKPDKWLGSELKAPQTLSFTEQNLSELLQQAPQKTFAASEQRAGYIYHRRSAFADQGLDRELARSEHEFVMPAKASTNVASVLPLAVAADGEVYVGLKKLNLPAPQTREDNSCLFVAPSHRLPATVTSLEQATQFVAGKYEQTPDRVSKLGEGYFSSIGLTPERLFPFAVTMTCLPKNEALHFVRLGDIFTHLDQLRDAPLMIASLRTVHALDLWSRYSSRLQDKVEQRPTMNNPQQLTLHL